MDLGVAPHHSCHLAGLLPPTSPPPLGQGTRKSRRTTSHFDSHTMGDHESEIPKQPTSPHPLWEDEPSSTYATPAGSSHHSTGL